MPNAWKIRPSICYDSTANPSGVDLRRPLQSYSWEFRNNRQPCSFDIQISVLSGCGPDRTLFENFAPSPWLSWFRRYRTPHDRISSRRCRPSSPNNGHRRRRVGRTSYSAPDTVHCGQPVSTWSRLDSLGSAYSLMSTSSPVTIWTKINIIQLC